MMLKLGLRLTMSCKVCGSRFGDDDRTEWKIVVALCGATETVCPICCAPPEYQEPGQLERFRKRQAKKALAGQKDES